MKHKQSMTTNEMKVLSLLYHKMQNHHYGLSISRDTGLSNSALYPVLEHLENIGLIRARWEKQPKNIAKRPKRYYYLTSKGILLYEEERKSIYHGAPSQSLNHPIK